MTDDDADSAHEPFPEWRRSKPYSMDDLDKSAILRVASWHNPELDEQGHEAINITSTSIGTSLESSDTFPVNPPNANLGALEKFPLELIYEAMHYLDIASLLQFMRGNRRAWSLVTNLSPALQ